MVIKRLIRLKSSCIFGGYNVFTCVIQLKMLAGLGAGISEAIFAVTPMETIKVKFINDRRKEKPQYCRFIHGVRMIIKEQGIGGVYKGVVATMMKQGFLNPFRRPWMEQNSAASAPGNKGPKGIVAGGITGGIEVCITYPTEYVKTHLQLDEKGDRKQYDGIIDCVKKTVKRHGFFGLYRGLSILIYGSIPKSAVRFGSFEMFKGMAMDENGNLNPGTRLLCGLGAGISEAILAVTPMETIKVKFINDRRKEKPQYRGFIHGVRMIIKEEGIGGVYKGVVATMMKQGTNQAIRFFVMETLKDNYRGGDNSVVVPKYYVGLFGTFAGACSVFGNNPVDVVKTRMQGLEAHLYKNTLHCFVMVWKNEGPLAFYKGTVPRLTRVCIDVAITFMIYDSFMDFFNKVWP